MLRGLDETQAFTPDQSIQVPVHNFIDDVTWTHGNHTFQVGGNYRRIDVFHYNNTNSYSTASTNPSWYAGAGIADTGNPFDPTGYNNNPQVAGYWTNNYDYPVGALIGSVSRADLPFDDD